MDVEADCGEEDERRSNGVTEKIEKVMKEVKEVKVVERRVRDSVVNDGVDCGE